ncbi:SRPBCC family protein [Streptomyces sp. NPDC090306]|uniref:SRPBCC family protein n=1 Tax=unclassified Streptomyces TaxID=2593676 RepID=UPI0036EBDB4B
MAGFLLERTVPLPLDEAWRRLTDWPRHAGVVPLTRITVRPPGPTRVGTVVVARSGVGPLAFDDPMEVTVWRPPADAGPGTCRLVKRGSVFTGWAEIDVRPGPGGRARVTWQEDIRLRYQPTLADRPVNLVARSVFGRAVNALLRQP